MSAIPINKGDGLDRLLAPAVLVGSVVLLQYHSIVFWNHHVGGLGWAWSLLLELAALWLWYKRSFALRVFGFWASLLLLAGPFYTVSAPLLERDQAEAQTAERREQTIASLNDEIRSLERELDTYLKNSESRHGWHIRIDDTRSRLADRRERLRTALAVGEQATLSWLRQAVIVMQAIALVLFQFTSVLAVTSISRHRRAMREPFPLPQDSAVVSVRMPAPASDGEWETGATGGSFGNDRLSDRFPDGTAGAMSCSMRGAKQLPVGTARGAMETAGSQVQLTVELIEQIAEAFTDYLDQHKLSQNTFATEYNYNRRDLSLLKNHRANMRDGRRTASEATIRRLGEQFGILPTLEGVPE